MWTNSLKNYISHILQLIFWHVLHKKSIFGTPKIKKLIFIRRKNKLFFGNIVRHSKMHACVQYEVFLRNYEVNVAITSDIWPESHESSFMIANFCEHFFKIVTVFQVYIFMDTRAHIMTQREGFPLF